ncbi:peptidylprolyl isomerase fpr4 [Lambiella insularis]|nr:peptidylprolyl isomerase fpr4 [Lambiella insularis]
MSGLLPAAVFGLEVPAGDVAIPALPDFPAAFRITMAAIDPSAEPEYTGTVDSSAPIRATLKLIRQPYDPEDEEGSEGDSEDQHYLNALLNGEGSEDDDESSSDEEKNGGPSDPSKSKKARKEAAVEQLKAALAEDDGEDEMEVEGVNGIKGDASKLTKGKAKAIGDGNEDSDEEGDSEDIEIEEFVLCTLDPTKNYQQPLDITIGEDERVFFKVSGTHAIFLTGNYVIPVDDGHRHPEDEDYDDEDYDLSPDEDELDASEESDELDALEDPRITELASEDEEPPKLVKAEKQSKKGKNKRPASESDDEPAGLDDMMAKVLKPEEPATNGEPKLSKKQLKKLKNNAGQAVPSTIENKNIKKVDPPSSESPNSKKVQFAKDLEQGPSGAMTNGKTKTAAEGKKDEKTDEKKDGDKGRASLGVKTVQGVTVDDKKLGTGPAAKKGNRVGMRYIGKLKDGKVFDGMFIQASRLSFLEIWADRVAANKKGKPFSFKLGSGEVIKGWDIGVAGMSVGGERRITIPASLAYGSKSQPGIPANSPLVFDLKLLEIN